MKKVPIQATISIIDEIFKNQSRQRIIGTLLTGIGLTISSVGITVLVTKPQNEKTKIEEKNLDEAK